MHAKGCNKTGLVHCALVATQQWTGRLVNYKKEFRVLMVNFHNMNRLSDHTEMQSEHSGTDTGVYREIERFLGAYGTTIS